MEPPRYGPATFSCPYVGRRPSKAHWRSTAGRPTEFGRPSPVSFPSIYVAYPSMIQGGDFRARGPRRDGSSRQSSRSLGFLVGIVRCARCPYSCTARISPHPRCCPKLGDGDGGVGQRKMTGPSSNGTANPLDTFEGSSTMTVTRAAGVCLTSKLTAAAYDSIRCATGSTQARMSAG